MVVVEDEAEAGGGTAEEAEAVFEGMVEAAALPPEVALVRPMVLSLSIIIDIEGCLFYEKCGGGGGGAACGSVDMMACSVPESLPHIMNIP
mmetsp:Transcript_285/g.558  ORF Transcript_285/g.558 Transcript_285/m.558 type:complete len:91 (+) Transcript_285:2013-2285(+)